MHTKLELKILEALKTYAWTPDAVVYCFADYLGHSEANVRRALGQLVEAQEVERIQEGIHRGRPRYIYRLIEKND